MREPRIIEVRKSVIGIEEGAFYVSKKTGRYVVKSGGLSDEQNLLFDLRTADGEYFGDACFHDFEDAKRAADA